MKISTSQFFQRAVDVMIDKQNQLSKTEGQLASGLRINSPSDDPSAAVQVLDLKDSLSRLNQYQRNIDVAEGRLNQEETGLNSMVNLLQRVRELAVQGNTDTVSPADRDIIAKELHQRLDEFLQLANTRDANDEYIFAGYKTETPALSHDGIGGFTYNGDSGQRIVKIGESRAVAIGDPGSDIFMNLGGVGGPRNDTGGIIYSLIENYEAGNSDANALTDLDIAMEQILNTQAKIGGRGNSLDDQYAANEAFSVAVDSVRSSLEDLDYAEAISRFNQQLVALQASQQSFMQIQGLNLFNFL